MKGASRILFHELRDVLGDKAVLGIALVIGYRHRASMVVLLSIIAFSVASNPPNTVPADVAEGTLVSARIVDGFTPYHTVTYEVLWRQNVAVANHYRGLVNYSEPFHDMALVTREELRSLLDELQRLQAFSLPDVDAPQDAFAHLHWEIEVQDGNKKHTFKVSAPELQSDARYGAIIERVRTFVLRHAGDLVFRNVFFEPGTYGWVNLTSVPPATVTIDGRDTGLKTPVYGYELPAGRHEVRLYAKEQKWERLHTVRIDPGMTTIVHFDLR